MEAIRELPDDVSIAQIADRIEFMSAIHRGLEDLKNGETIPHDEVKKQLKVWFSE